MTTTGEVFTWPEGDGFVFTAAGSSALLAFAQNTTVQCMYGTEHFRTLDGTWRTVRTGEEAIVTIQAFYSQDHVKWWQIASANVDTNLHLFHRINANQGSAGVWLYSGRIEQLAIQGGDGQTFMASLMWRGHIWTAY